MKKIHKTVKIGPTSMKLNKLPECDVKSGTDKPKWWAHAWVCQCYQLTHSFDEKNWSNLMTWRKKNKAKKANDNYHFGVHKMEQQFAPQVRNQLEELLTHPSRPRIRQQKKGAQQQTWTKPVSLIWFISVFLNQVWYWFEKEKIRFSFVLRTELI